MRASRSFRSVSQLITSAVLCCGLSDFSVAEEPLHQRIDAVVQSTAIGPVADSVDDLTFVRRLYLDLTGQIPSSAQSRQFLANDAPDRRTQLVDQLLASPDFNRHLATIFDVMLMERRGNAHVKTEDFRAWLQQSFEQNKPFHQLASELIAADPTGPAPATAFFLERGVEPNLMTREISRTFFGRDIQCAQCHDHPNVDGYKQEEYYGIYAFVNRSSLFQPDKKKPAVISETADGHASFKSVFTSREAFTSPRLPGEAEVVEPVFAAGEEYTVSPSKTVAGVPRYSRRARLAELVATGQNVYFRRNIANRLWAKVMGRGLVQPVDMHHSMNPPSHPQLMTLLADEIAAMNFDVKAFLRELVLTDVYQRAHKFQQTPTIDIADLTAAIEQLKQQKDVAVAESAAKEEIVEAALKELDAAIAAAEPVRAAWEKSRAAAVAAAKKQADAAAVESSKRGTVEQKKILAAHLTEAFAKTQAAAERLGQPQELATITTALKTRGDKTTAELAKLQKDLEAAARAAATATQALETAQAADAAEREKLTPLTDVMQQHRQRLVRSFHESQRSYERVSSAERSVDYLQQLIAKQQASTSIPRIEATVASTDQQQQQATSTVSTAEQQMAAAIEQMKIAEAARQQADQQARQQSEQMQSATEAAEVLAAALARANAAAEILQRDSAMDELVVQLERSGQRLSQKVGEAHARLDDATAKLQQSTAQVEQMQAAAAKARQQADAASQQVVALQKTLDELHAQLTEATAAKAAAMAEVDQHAVRQFHLATVEPLSPEQLAFSILQASGQRSRQVDAELAKLNKEKPLKADQQTEAVLAERRQQAEAAAAASLHKTAASLINLFAAEAGQPQDAFFATVDQALFFANGSQVRSWLAPSADNLTARLLKIETAESLAEELYLSILVRKPETDEIQDVAQYLKVRGDRKSAAVQELAWALMTSAEFRFQY
ncbi:MAG: DUF1549 domain-containing protein [Planctomycetaceae bacterium]